MELLKKYTRSMKKLFKGKSTEEEPTIKIKNIRIPGLKIKCLLGVGFQGRAYKATYKNQVVCAKRYTCFEYAKQESDMLEAAQKSCSVPKIFKKFINKKQNVILMELVEGQDLLSLFKDNSISTELMHQIIYKIMVALEDLHSTGIIHNDIKEDNIMVNIEDNCSVKIIDLGKATVAGGTPYKHYFMGDNHLDPMLENGGKCSKITDLFSLGKMMIRIYDRAPEKYMCEKIKKYGEMLLAHKGNQFDATDLLADNCECCALDNCSVNLKKTC